MKISLKGVIEKEKNGKLFFSAYNIKDWVAKELVEVIYIMDITSPQVLAEISFPLKIFRKTKWGLNKKRRYNCE